MRAILHIGIEKTGSTSIQKYLAAKRTDLLRERIAVLRSIGSPSNRFLATYAIADDRTDDSLLALGLHDHQQKQTEVGVCSRDEVASERCRTGRLV